MSITNPDNVVTKQTLSDLYTAIRPYLAGEEKKDIIYGFHIDDSESVPSAKVTYLEDAVGMTPAYMDYTNNVFNYGSWGNAFFMPKPCMLKYDGTVDYYLDPNDYTKKEDGTASDIADVSYGGNAMMEWGQKGRKIWLKIVPDSEDDNKSADIYIANYKADSNFTDWPFHNSLGQSVNHFYTAIYNGSVQNNVLRSLSGFKTTRGNTGDVDVTRALANNQTQDVIWNAELFSDITLINILLILIGKSTNTQEVFGQGIAVSSDGSEAKMKGFLSGIHNDKGLFYGTNDGTASVYTNAVKVFGMENWWGLQWRRYLGLISVSGVRKVKLTYGTEDGSTVTGYNYDGTGYVETNVPAPSGGTGYGIKSFQFTEQGMFPVITSSSLVTASTYYCDYMRYRNSVNSYPCRGGYVSLGSSCGAFADNYYYAVTEHYWYYGTSISAKPLS